MANRHWRAFMDIHRNSQAFRNLFRILFRNLYSPFNFYYNTTSQTVRNPSCL